MKSNVKQAELAERPASPASDFFPTATDLSKFFEFPSYISLLSDLVYSPAFQRLRDIRFLGAIDYLMSPNGTLSNRRHTRFEHSLCVARLARTYARECALPESSEVHLVVAALLHDIGHGPLSHSMEPVFWQRFHLTHHQATEHMIRGDVPIGSELPKIFRQHKIQRELVLALISGNASESYSEAFSSPINIDTIEAISRAFMYIAPKKTPPPPARIVTAMIHRHADDAPILDGFWHQKNIVYSQLINSYSGVLADYCCRTYIESNPLKFWGGDCFSTETQLRKEHPELFRQLRSLRRVNADRDDIRGELITYEKRHFFIDESVPVTDAKSLHERYRQERTPAQLRVGVPANPAKLDTHQGSLA